MSVKITTGTHVLVADGEKALLLENLGDAQDLNLQVHDKQVQENPPTGEQGTDKPGRFSDGPEQQGVAAGQGFAQRSSVADTDWHRLAKDRFADDLAEMLYKKVHAGEIKQLVIAAPAQVLGEIRHKMHKEVSAVLVGEVGKDLTNHPVDQIEKALSA
ncbi:host attachment family protein [Tranquillimonas alkanivorans]|uniref:Protein required for attachment to host cells n=1 Tax=Tranquillimonas alkanivorans TaxID=441119 RepID=A0A1I5NSQ6_9RHOB|nr:host attachment family protein [Tranquillimonas alkanivorans]SFP24261.1 Protein required for attachment to host cells [Tranquillimonas alkanivorans]